MVLFDQINDKNRRFDLEISQKEKDEGWDNFLEKHPEGAFEQTSFWAQAKKRYGWKPIRVLLRQNEKIIGGAQILYKKKPFLGGFGYISKGPVFNTDNEHEVNVVLNNICKAAKDYKIRLLYINPHENITGNRNPLPQYNFSRDHFQKYISANLLINLTKDIDILFKEMRRNHRRSVTKGIKNGVTIREGGRDEISIFFKLMLITCKRQGVSPNPPDEEYIYELWDLLKPQDKIHLFVAEYNKEIVTAIILISFGAKLTAWKIGWSGEHKDKNPNNVLYWETMKWAKEKVFSSYDFLGIDRNVADAVVNKQKMPEGWEKTVACYKLGFGGEIKLLPDSFVYIYNPILRWGYEKIFPRLKTRIFLKK